jgi:hypothetical protein
MVLRNITIQTPEGLPVFGRSLVCNIGTFCVDLSKDITFQDETILKSGLLTALLTVKEAEKGSFHELELEKSHILSYPTNNLIGTIEVSPEDVDDTLKNRIKVIVELFQRTFSKELENYIGDSSIFNSFTQVIEENNLLEEGEKFRKNCINCRYSKTCAFRVTTGPFYETIKEKLESIPEINMILKMILMMLGMPGMMIYGIPKRQT